MTIIVINFKRVNNHDRVALGWWCLWDSIFGALKSLFERNVNKKLKVEEIDSRFWLLLISLFFSCAATTTPRRFQWLLIGVLIHSRIRSSQKAWQLASLLSSKLRCSGDRCSEFVYRLSQHERQYWSSNHDLSLGETQLETLSNISGAQIFDEPLRNNFRFPRRLSSYAISIFYSKAIDALL
jgi:hypothetical protein